VNILYIESTAVTASVLRLVKIMYIQGVPAEHQSKVSEDCIYRVCQHSIRLTLVKIMYLQGAAVVRSV
jgi:hypothetical protein